MADAFKPDDPEFLVGSGKSGAKAAHEPGELRKKGAGGATKSLSR